MENEKFEDKYVDSSGNLLSCVADGEGGIAFMCNGDNVTEWTCEDDPEYSWIEFLSIWKASERYSYLQRIKDEKAEKPGVDMIRIERLRQIEGLGYTAESDLTHNSQWDLIAAAMSYLCMSKRTPQIRAKRRVKPPRIWPWSKELWKPGEGDYDRERVRELVKAGALIAAQIDRLKLLIKYSEGAE